jgi:glycerol-3-phosphate acyltransferase PlsY
MNYLAASLIGYLLGSFPTAYIILKKAKGIDITTAGSGNAGAMNSFEVSNSKIIGLIVFIIDALKGLLGVYLSLLIFPIDFIFPALALLFAVLSHCYNPWTNFKGGRGLATAAGGTALLFPFILVLWGILWLIIFSIKRHILFANIWANLMTLVLVFLSSNVAYKYSFPKPDSMSTLLMFSSALLTIVFIKHIEPLKDIIKNKSFFVKGSTNV